MALGEGSGRKMQAIPGRMPVDDDEAMFRDAGFTWEEIDEGTRLKVAPIREHVSFPDHEVSRAAVIEGLVYQAERSRALADATRQRVVEARKAGIEWAIIGNAFGIDAEAARYRWGRGR